MHTLPLAGPVTSSIQPTVDSYIPLLHCGKDLSPLYCRAKSRWRRDGERVPLKLIEFQVYASPISYLENPMRPVGGAGSAPKAPAPS